LIWYKKKERPAITPLFNKLTEKIEFSQQYKVNFALPRRKYLREIIMHEIETGSEHPQLSQNNLRFLYNTLLPKGKRKLKLLKNGK